MSGALLYDHARDPATNVGRAWLQDSLLARTGEELVLRLRHFEGAFQPPRQPGYNVFEQDGLAGYEDALPMFRGSVSPEDTAFRKTRIDMLRERARQLDDAGMSRVVAGLLSPENLLTLPVPLMAGGATAAAQTMRAAALGGAVAGGTTLLAGAADQTAMPAQLRGDLLNETVLSTLMGAALGGALGGVVSARSLDRTAKRFSAVHGAYEGRTPPPGGKVPPAGEAAGGAPGAPVDVPPPTARMTPEEVRAHVAALRPQPLEQLIDGQWATLKAEPLSDTLLRSRADLEAEVAGIADPHTRAAALRELEFERLFPETERAAIEADLDLLSGPRTRLTAANDEAVAEIEMRLDAIARLFERLDVPPGAANENVHPGRLRLLEMADAWFADLRDEAANLNLRTWPRKEGGPRGVWWDALVGTHDAGDARPAVNENVPGGPRGGDDLTIPPAPPVPPRELPTMPPAPEGSARLAPGSGLERLRWDEFPFYVLKANQIAGVLGEQLARLAEGLLPIPGLRTVGNAGGFATDTGSVVSMAWARWMPRYMETLGVLDRGYFAYRGWDQNKSGPFVNRAVGLGEGAARFFGRGGEAMDQAEFSAAVLRLIEDPTIPEMPPAAREVAARLSDILWKPVAKEAAEAGVLLVPEHIPEARAAIARQRQVAIATLGRAETMERDLAARAAAGDAVPGLAGAQQAIMDLREWLVALDGRSAALDEMVATGRQPRPYVPHVANRTAILADREGLADRIADYWLTTLNGTEHTWATPQIRAEIALSHLAGQPASDALERTIYRTLRDRGMAPPVAAARAAELAAPLKALETNRPGNLRFEANAALGRSTPGPDVEAVHAQVVQALDAVGVVRGEGQQANAFHKLVEEIAPDRAAERSRDLALPGHARERRLDVPLSIIGDYLDLDLHTIGAGYVERMSRAIEMSRKYGDPSFMGARIGMTLDLIESGADPAEIAKQLRALENSRDLALLNIGAPETADAWSVRTLTFLKNHAIATQMGKGLYAAMTDTGRVVMEHGFRPLFDGIAQQIVNGDGWRLARREAELSAVASEMTLLRGSRSMFDMEAIGAERSWLERMAGKAAETTMFINLLALWTQKAQEFAGVLTQHYMVEAAIRLRDGTASAEDVTRMAHYGFDVVKATRIADAYEAAGRQSAGSLRIANTEAWGDRALVDEFRAALKTAVDSQVVRPGAADTPMFMSAPLAQGLLLYKRFGISATQRVLAAGLQRRDMMVVGGMLSSVAIAWFFADPPAGDRDKNPIFSAQRLATAIEKSGVLGIFTDVNNAMELVSGQNVGVRPLLGLDPPLYAKRGSWADQLGAALGPAVNPWLTLTWALTDPDAKSDERAGAIRRMIWFNNQIWFDPIFRALSREAGSAMHTPTERAPAPGPLVR